MAMTTIAVGGAGPADAARATRLAALAGMPARAAGERVGYALVGLMAFVACFTSFKPAPYEFVAFPAMVLWLVLGLRPHRSILVFAGFLLAWRLGVVAALIPHVDDPESVSWAAQSVYLLATALFFAAFFSEATERRLRLVLAAFAASCVLAAAAGVASYFVESGPLFATYGRAGGFFPDPNVFGSYLTLGIVYFARLLFTGETRRPILVGGCLLLLLAGVFLSFSRGSWASALVAVALMGALTLRTSPGRIRRRILVIAVGAFGIAALGIVGLLSVGSVGERFTDRAQLSQDYDEGETGRFGNQIRSIPMLLERPNGFGPLRFYLTFGIDPHSSYIGGFANGGWLGGIGFVGLVAATLFVAARLCLTAWPLRPLAHVVCPTMLMFFLQAFQIDIDPWRHVYMLMGMVWGLEAARAKWAAGAPLGVR